MNANELLEQLLELQKTKDLSTLVVRATDGAYGWDVKKINIDELSIEID